MKVIVNNQELEIDSVIAALKIHSSMTNKIPLIVGIEHLLNYLEEWWKTVGVPTGFNSAYIYHDESILRFIVFSDKEGIFINEDRDEDLLTDLDLTVAHNLLFRESKINMSVQLFPLNYKDGVLQGLPSDTIQIG